MDSQSFIVQVDSDFNLIRRIVISSGAVSTVAGSSIPGSANGIGTSASFLSPTGIAFDGAGTFALDVSYTRANVFEVSINTK